MLGPTTANADLTNEHLALMRAFLARVNRVRPVDAGQLVGLAIVTDVVRITKGANERLTQKAACGLDKADGKC